MQGQVCGHAVTSPSFGLVGINKGNKEEACKAQIDNLRKDEVTDVWGCPPGQLCAVLVPTVATYFHKEIGQKSTQKSSTNSPRKTRESAGDALHGWS